MHYTRAPVYLQYSTKTLTKMQCRHRTIQKVTGNYREQELELWGTSGTHIKNRLHRVQYRYYRMTLCDHRLSEPAITLGQLWYLVVALIDVDGMHHFWSRLRTGDPRTLLYKVVPGAQTRKKRPFVTTVYLNPRSP